MIFLMTKDSFLLQGFWQLKDNHEMIKINSLSEIKKVGNKPFKVIIDTYHNHILDEEAIKFLEKLDAKRIIVLAPYHISKLKAKAPIYFVSRKESIKNLLEITGSDSNLLIVFYVQIMPDDLVMQLHRF